MLEVSLRILGISHLIVKREISFMWESNSQISFLILRGNWFPSPKEEVKGLMSWLRWFLIFVLEWLLDPKFVDIVSLNYGAKETI